MLKLPYITNFKVVVVGVGGTGGILVQNLAHYLYGRYSPKVRLIVVDGDLVEPANIGRQKFAAEDLGRNKAERIALRYSDVFGLDIEYVPEYVREEETLAGLVLPDDVMPSQLPVLVMCVDNNFSRKIAHRVFFSDRVRDLVYIDTGNEDGRGQTVVGVKWRGFVYQDPCGSVFPDILESQDQIGGNLSCGRTVQEKPQTLLENVWSATVALTYLFNILENHVVPSHYVFFDALAAQARSVKNSRINGTEKISLP